MPLEDKVAFASRLLKAGASLVSLAVPTIALVQLGRLPDGLSRTAFIVLPAASLALIVAIMMLGPRIRRLNGTRAAAFTLMLAAAGAVFTVGYSRFAEKYVIERTIYEQDGRVEILRDIRPIHTSDEIRDIIRRYNDRYDRALERSPRRRDLKELMDERNLSARALILIFMTLAQLLFVMAIVGGAWWLAERYSASRGRRLAGASRNEGSDDIKA